MTIHTPARASMRALCGAAALGSSVGLAIGGAYFAGGAANASVTHTRGTQVAGAPVAGTLDGLQPVAPVQLASAPAPVAAPKPLQLASLNLPKAPVVPGAPFALRDKADDSRDLECLTQAVYYEARGEPDSGQAAVAQVVLNRTRHPRFPKSVCGVVFQHTGGGCQFSFACDSQVRHPRETAAWRRSEKVAARALGGFVMADVGAATDFRGGHGAPAGLLRVAQIGGHVFYRFAGRLGGAQALTGQAQASTAVPHTVMASFSAPDLLAASAKVVERAAAAVESVGKLAPTAATTASVAAPKTEEPKASAPSATATAAPVATPAVSAPAP